MPKSVALKIKKLQREFLSKSVENSFGMHLLAWDIFCSPKSKGGMGLRRMTDMNVALLCKWLWRLGLEEDWLWKRVLMEKYWIQDVWNPNEMHRPNRRSLWKGIVRHLESFKKGIDYDMGKGNRIAFWEDKWCGGSPLKETYLDVFFLAENRLASGTQI